MSAHARLGPSASERWSLCTRSISFVEDLIKAGTIPEYEEPSVYALEGIELHRVFASAMEAVGKILVKPDWWRAEERIEIPLAGKARTFGTADLVGYEEVLASAHVVDWKFGKGVPVDALHNPQLALYGWGWIHALKAEKRSVETIHLTICQPRIKKQEYQASTWSLDPKELEEFLQPIFKASERILKDFKTEFYPSDSTCRWCRGRPYCPHHNPSDSDSQGEDVNNLLSDIEENYNGT